MSQRTVDYRWVNHGYSCIVYWSNWKRETGGQVGTDWMINWLIDWLIDWLTKWLMIHWLIIHRTIDWLAGWFTGWLAWWLADWSWLAAWLKSLQTDQKADWQTSKLINWLGCWLNDGQLDWLHAQHMLYAETSMLHCQGPFKWVDEFNWLGRGLMSREHACSYMRRWCEGPERLLVAPPPEAHTGSD